MALFTFMVAGTTFRPKKEVLTVANALFEGKDLDVYLEAEPDNQYDPNAVKVIIDNYFIGYVPRQHATYIAMLLRNGRKLSTSVELRGYGEYENPGFLISARV